MGANGAAQAWVSFSNAAVSRNAGSLSPNAVFVSGYHLKPLHLILTRPSIMPRK